jgi:GAF domain-containing protein
VLTQATELEQTGLEVVDIAGDAAFQARKIHSRNATAQLAAIKRIARTFVDDPEHVLQDLVESAIDLCGADSAAISLVKEGGSDEAFYHWVASAGVYRSFMDAMLPRYPSACGLCLERNRPQRIRVTKRFFDILGVEAQPVTDGLLLPWRVGRISGTIFVMAHQRSEAFDSEDLNMMETLADFAAMGVRQVEQRKRIMLQATAAASAAMAHELAHEINNPLQSLTNLLYLARSEGQGERELALKLTDDVNRLNDVAARLLRLPKEKLDALKSVFEGQ